MLLETNKLLILYHQLTSIVEKIIQDITSFFYEVYLLTYFLKLLMASDQVSESPITPLNKNIISALKSACARKGINDSLILTRNNQVGSLNF